jgi:hypothetical protein
LLPSIEARVRWAEDVCVRDDGENKVAEILLAKLLDGHRASFVRSEGELFVVSVSGQERTISRKAWRLLPEQQERVEHLNDRRGRREHGG